MASEAWIHRGLGPKCAYLQKFRLYETRSNFYMIGRDKSRTFWRVLKIDRMEPNELNILEDATVYNEAECFDLLRRIHEGNRATGGLKFITICYGVVGFIRFLGPYYMLIITKRRKIGAICGHTIYAVAKTEMITIPNSSVQCNVANSKDEKRSYVHSACKCNMYSVRHEDSNYNFLILSRREMCHSVFRHSERLLRVASPILSRYKRLLGTVDLTKDFFFSYSYHVMHSLQKNMCHNEMGPHHDETMSVWNEFLTRGIRNSLHNSTWTVALVYGFFKQVKLSTSGKSFKLTLIARRSRHYAGTRYLKRGVNEKGRVANDVETEQILFEDVPEDVPVQITSVVQNRGSIPLYWSQETSRLNIKPDIILSKKDPKYEATRLHFQNLVKRYGNPIIILNLIKTHEKKPRETILRAEFANAIRHINKGLPKEERLRPLHWDLNRHSRNKTTNVLEILGTLATYALRLTGIFYCRMSPDSIADELQSTSCFEKSGDHVTHNIADKDDDASNLVTLSNNSGDHSSHALTLQRGVLRTNCIDCLDRTNVAQYAYGLAALGHQLHALGLTESTVVDLDNPLAEDLMGIYETMGDTLALQYGGSAAHNKIFSERRGQWKAATQSQEFFRTLQRYYSNAYMDAEKQDAINLFLGYFQPQQGKPALWEMGSDQHYNFARYGADLAAEKSRSVIKRSLSEGSILCESGSAGVGDFVGHDQHLPGREEASNGLSESTPEIPTSGTVVSCSRQLFEDMVPSPVFENDCICHEEHGDQCRCTSLDIDWLSSSGNSCEEDLYDRFVVGQSSENIVGEIKFESTSASESGSSLKGGERNVSENTCEEMVPGFPERFIRWVMHGEGHFR